jgi:crotonobetainyl-CoA:carnitine CoA-transferase CaiB-like acyl-CoA transferase
VLRIAAGCDVFMENFRGGKAAALGLDEAAVRARRPDIIYASLSGYGSRGPDSTRAGYDAVLQARTGIMSITGEFGRTHSPIRSGVSVLDMGGGTWTALGILAALFERQRSGKGQNVSSSLFQTGIMFMSYHLLYRQFAGVNPQPQGSGHTAFVPYGAFATADGSVMLGISSDRLFQNLCTALDKPEWLSDRRFRTNTDRVRHRPELDGMIQDLLRARPSAHWVDLLTRHDVACDAVQTVDQVLADPQLSALDQLADLPLAGEPGAAVPRLPIDLSLTPAEVSGPPPAVGEHTRAVLKEAGYQDAEIDELVNRRVCPAGT